MTDGATAADFSQKLLPAKIRLVARAADEKSERERATRRDVGKRVIGKEDAHWTEKMGGRDAKCNCVFGFEGERAKCRRHLFVGVGAGNRPYLSVTNEIDRGGRLLSLSRSPEK